MKKILALFLGVFVFGHGFTQSSFPFGMKIIPKSIPGLSGIHSYAFGQIDEKWIIIGGRLDGIHARQPFNAFPESQNNTSIFCIDPISEQFWQASLTGLPTAVVEQLQSTNMNFHQLGDTLYIVGGYGFSNSAQDHITHPQLTTVQLDELVQHVVNGASILNDFKTLTDQRFAVTGGHLEWLDTSLVLVGGHRFDGRYNPMNNPTYTQAYTNEIRKFNIDNTGAAPIVTSYMAINDPLHLHRRDYNLIPQHFPDGTDGFMISSGVFQIGVNLPFLYPIDIRLNGHTPRTAFNQYLSHYHSAVATIYDSVLHENHAFFFGGMSQYYYSNGNLVQDDQVPFVKTISRVTRASNDSLFEVQFPIEMPGYLGANAEFIPNPLVPQSSHGMIYQQGIVGDSVLIGHIFGGLKSSTLNPFSNNTIQNTQASSNLYEVWLYPGQELGVFELNGKNDFSITINPNPVNKKTHVQLNGAELGELVYYLVNKAGKFVQGGEINVQEGTDGFDLVLRDDVSDEVLTLICLLNEKYMAATTLLMLD
jgi:hypothetical protein